MTKSQITTVCQIEVSPLRKTHKKCYIIMPILNSVWNQFLPNILYQFTSYVNWDLSCVFCDMDNADWLDTIGQGIVATKATLSETMCFHHHPKF